MSTPLSTLLGEYAVPLRVWLGPAARRLAADIIVEGMGQAAEVTVDPLQTISQLEGPAVLVVAADDLEGPDQGALRALAKTAQPGRVVLIGGTSDRDVLMAAINTWRAVRVVPATAPSADIVAAVQAAGEALRKAVALATAIDDLDIENTMLGSAIQQMESGRERQLRATERTAMSTVSHGLAETVRREQAALVSLVEDDVALATAMRGVTTVTDVLSQVSIRGSERSAGTAPTPESVDALVAAAVELARAGPGAEVRLDAATGATTLAHPYALVHLLTSVVRSCRAAGEVAVRCTAEGESVHIRITGSVPSISSAEGPLARSIAVLRAEGVEIGVGGSSDLAIILPNGERAS